MTIESNALAAEAAPEVIASDAELLPVDDVLELQRTTARTARLRAAKDELRAAYEYAQVLTHSTSINPEFQAYAERTKNRKVSGQWRKETLPPLGEQAIYNLAVAIIYGDKLGWSPEESAMRVFSVHGKPSIEAKDAVAFITAFIEIRLADGRTQPFLEGGDWIWQVESTDTKAVWTSRRNGVEVSSEWTMGRAEQAKYTENEKYQTNPAEMLRWKAAMEVARIQWMDVLRGIAYSREELELESPSVTVVSERPVSRKGVGALEQMLADRKANHLQVDTGVAASQEQDDESPAPEPTVVPEPAPDPEPNVPDDPSASTAQVNQVKKLLATVEKLTDPNAADTLEFVGGMVSRPIAALTDLTNVEADDVINLLSQPKPN